MAGKQKLVPIENAAAIHKRDGTPLYGDEAARYGQAICDALGDNDLFMQTDKEADEGELCWLEGDESMPEVSTSNYELTYDSLGRVYPTVALRNTDGTLLAGAKMTAEDMVEFGKWCFKSAFFKLGLAKSGMGGKGVLQDSTRAKAALVDQVNDILDSLIEMAPEVVADRVSAHGKAALVEQIKGPIQKHVMAQGTAFVQSARLQHAKDIVEIAKIATRVEQEFREEGLSDLRIERLIVDAKELINAHSPSNVPTTVTR